MRRERENGGKVDVEFSIKVKKPYICLSEKNSNPQILDIENIAFSFSKIVEPMTCIPQRSSKILIDAHSLKTNGKFPESQAW